MNLPSHGSNPEKLYKSHSLKQPEEIIDFSVNLNPFGTLPAIKENWASWFSLIEDYPDPTGEQLREAIALSEKLSSKQVLLGNGGAQIITLIANYLAGKRVGIVQPTFVEYQEMCTVYGCQIEHIKLDENRNWENLDSVFLKIEKLDALFLCHPNNPTGVLYSQEQIERLINRCEDEKCYLIIDEAFCHFVEKFPTAARFIEDKDYLIVVRSLTKMYSIAGLRLGYALAPERVIKALQARQAHWSINVLAIEAGLLCVDAKTFTNRTQIYIENEGNRVLEKLTQLGYLMSKSEVNYYLLRDDRLDNQGMLIKYLLKRGIVPRHTENFLGLDGRWLRFAIKKETENDILIKALQEWMQLNK